MRRLFAVCMCCLISFGAASAEDTRTEQETQAAFKRCDDEVFAALAVGRYVFMEKRSGAIRQSNAVQNGKTDTLIQELESQAYPEIDTRPEKWRYTDFAARRLYMCGVREKLDFGETNQIERCFIGPETIYWLMTNKDNGLAIEEATQITLKRLPDRNQAPEKFVRYYAQRVFENTSYEQNNRMMRGFFYGCLNGS